MRVDANGVVWFSWDGVVMACQLGGALALVPSIVTLTVPHWLTCAATTLMMLGMTAGLWGLGARLGVAAAAVVTAEWAVLLLISLKASM